MRKGLGVTLLTVAIAMMGLKAMSSAPIIDEVPNPIVGDKVGSSSSNVFVYPDAITLSATDETSASGIVWTFTVADPTDPRYYLNGYGPVDLAQTDADNNPDNPSSAKRIDQETMGNDEVTSDTNPHTVTIRDHKLSPFPKQNSYTDPVGGPGIVGTEVITLIASDGTTHGTRDFIAWTEDEGEDRYSGRAKYVTVGEADFLTSEAAFVTSSWGASGTSLATMTWNTSTGKGLCMQTPAGSESDSFVGSWASPYGWFDLVENAVYKVRMTVSSTSTQVQTVPLWTFYVENYGSEAEGWPGKNAYALQIYELDNEGGANAPASYGRGASSVYYYYFTPAQVQAPQWNTTAFTEGNDANNDPRVHFRVLDANANIVAQNRLGTLCMADMKVDRYDIGDVTRGTVVYNQTTFTANDGYVKAAVGTNVAYNGYVTMSPTGGNWTVEVATLGPGNQDGFNVESANIADNFPIAWPATSTVWMYEASVSAPTQTDADNPPDILALRIDTPTYEVFGNNQVQAIGLLGRNAMPTTTAATYTMFFDTQSMTASTLANYDAFRPLVEITCHTALPVETSTGFVNTNTGAIRVHSMKVTEVTF